MRRTRELTTQALESELVGLAGHLAAGHCRWLQLLAEFDRREGWAGPGMRSCAHWLSWRVGMNVRTGFEQLRVAHALSTLPEVTRAFAAGRISYSKVRAITRVATADTETTLLDLALGGTASHVERVVRHTRQATTDPATASIRRELHWRWEHDGTLIVRGRFTAEQGARLVAALAAQTDRVPTRDAVPPTHDAVRAVPPTMPVSHDEPCDAAVDSLDCSAEQCGTPVPVHSRHCSAEQCRTPVPVPIAARRADALVDLVIGDRPAATELVVVVDAGGSSGAAPAAQIVGGPAIPLRSAERIGCTARIRALLRDRRGNALYLGRTRRLASTAQMTALQIRDHGQCRFPGCDHTQHLEAHHIVPWLRGGRTDIDNLILICGHHHRVIHDKGYRVRGRGTDVTFHRPDGRQIAPAGAPTSGCVEELITDPTITADTITPDWSGERLDLDAVLSVLLPEASMAAA